LKKASKTPTKSLTKFLVTSPKKNNKTTLRSLFSPNHHREQKQKMTMRMKHFFSMGSYVFVCVCALYKESIYQREANVEYARGILNHSLNDNSSRTSRI